MILPAQHHAASASSRVLYAAIHNAVRCTLAQGAEATLATEDAPKLSHACFANPVKADVLINGRKIAGAAQRRTRAGLLHQGSIQFDALPAEFAERFAGALWQSCKQMTPSKQLEQIAQQIAAEKYETDGWLRRV
jgi:lipoate-protein ligase A